MRTLSIGAMRRMLSERLGVSLHVHVLVGVYDDAREPALLARVGRTIAGSGAPALTADMPLPQAVEDLVGTRVAQLDGPVRRLVLALALDPELRVSRIDAIADQTVSRTHSTRAWSHSTATGYFPRIPSWPRQPSPAPRT